eukprot:2224474-Pyramimonas_sp.AAC.1
MIWHVLSQAVALPLLPVDRGSRPQTGGPGDSRSSVNSSNPGVRTQPKKPAPKKCVSEVAHDGVVPIG